MACILGREMWRSFHSRGRRRLSRHQDQTRGAQARSPMRLSVFFFIVIWVLGCLVGGPGWASSLEDDLGRNEVRVYSGRFSIESGHTITQLDLPRRLERLGYERRRGQKPDKPGEYFFGFEKFWFYRQPVRIGKKKHPARMIGLRLRRDDGMILEGIDEKEAPLHSKHLWLEPELLAESF